MTRHHFYAFLVAAILALCTALMNGCVVINCSGGTPCYVTVDKPVDISGAVQGNVPVNGGTVTSPENKYNPDRMIVVPSPEIPRDSVFPIYRGKAFSNISTSTQYKPNPYHYSTELN